MNSKTEIRKLILNKRNNVTKIEQIKKSEQITSKLLNNPDFLISKNIALYKYFKGEIIVETLINKAFEMKKSVWLPCIKSNNLMDFVEYKPDCVLSLNKYNIFEPNKTKKTIDINKLDLIIMPLISFDLVGNRIGMGKGYYDRALANLKNKKSIKLIGVAYDWQFQTNIANDSHDIKLDYVITNNKTYTFNN